MKKEQISLKIINHNAAGIDVGSREHFVAIGQKPLDVKPFGVYAEDLSALAQWLLDNKITTVAMESTGVYWQNLFVELITDVTQMVDLEYFVKCCIFLSMIPNMLDLYTDYLITSTKYTTATGLAKIFDNKFSHDQVTRFLSTENLDNKKLWSFIKPFLRTIEKEDSVIIVDDTIFEKPYTDQSEINTYHYDHSKGKSVLGINAVNLIHETDRVRLPLSMSIVHKDQIVIENGKEKRKSSKTKNELFQEQFLQTVHNGVKFETVLADIWFGNIKNMDLITSKGKQFIMPLKTNRKVALFESSNKEKEYVPVKSLELKEDTPVKDIKTLCCYANKSSKTKTIVQGFFI